MAQLLNMHINYKFFIILFHYNMERLSSYFLNTTVQKESQNMENKSNIDISIFIGEHCQRSKLEVEGLVVLYLGVCNFTVTTLR